VAPPPPLPSINFISPHLTDPRCSSDSPTRSSQRIAWSATLVPPDCLFSLPANNFCSPFLMTTPCQAFRFFPKREKADLWFFFLTPFFFRRVKLPPFSRGSGSLFMTFLHASHQRAGCKTWRSFSLLNRPSFLMVASSPELSPPPSLISNIFPFFRKIFLYAHKCFHPNHGCICLQQEDRRALPLFSG